MELHTICFMHLCYGTSEPHEEVTSSMICRGCLHDEKIRLWRECIFGAKRITHLSSSLLYFWKTHISCAISVLFVPCTMRKSGLWQECIFGAKQKTHLSSSLLYFNQIFQKYLEGEMLIKTYDSFQSYFEKYHIQTTILQGTLSMEGFILQSQTGRARR